MKRLKTTKKFIEDCKLVHGNKYDYSLVEYVGNRKKVKIICSIHGEFNQIPYNHLSGKGCSKCGDKRKNIDKFIKESKNIHGDRYDYSLVDYKNMKTKVKIICPIHGEFEQIPKVHIRGSEYAKCSSDNRKISNVDFITRSSNKHFNFYDYSLTNYTGWNNQVEIICPKHGKFKQMSGKHLNGKGCPKCGLEKLSKIFRLDKNIFIERCKTIHLDKYDYSLVSFDNLHNKIKIICFKHDIFEQEANLHMNGSGCPICNESHGEK